LRGGPRPNPGHPSTRWPRAGTSRGGSDPASWPGRSGVCCWWSSPLAGRDQPADLAWQLRWTGSRGGLGQPRGRGRGQRRAVPAGVPGADPSADPRPGSWSLAPWSLGWLGRVLQAAGGFLVGHYLRHTSQVCGVFAIVLGLLFLVVSGRAADPCTPQRSTPWPPDGSDRAACCSRRWPTPTNPPQLTLPTNSNANPEEATRVNVTADQHPHQADVATPVPLLATARHRPATLSLADCRCGGPPIVALERLWGQAACAGVGCGLGSGSGIGGTGVGAPGRLADG